MKQFIFTLTLIVIMGNSKAQSKPTFTKTDAQMLCGEWKGTLTYLDYSSGKPYSMPANVIISAIKGSNNLLEQMLYPDEPKANSTDTLFIRNNGQQIDDAIIISRKILSNGSIEIITERNGKDGNDDKEAVIRKTYTISKSLFSIQKTIKFTGTVEWIKRHEYQYKKQ